jgi:hypothetical protein
MLKNKFKIFILMFSTGSVCKRIENTPMPHLIFFFRYV